MKTIKQAGKFYNLSKFDSFSIFLDTEIKLKNGEQEVNIPSELTIYQKKALEKAGKLLELRDEFERKFFLFLANPHSACFDSKAAVSYEWRNLGMPDHPEDEKVKQTNQ